MNGYDIKTVNQVLETHTEAYLFYKYAKNKTCSQKLSITFEHLEQMHKHVIASMEQNFLLGQHRKNKVQYFVPLSLKPGATDSDPNNNGIDAILLSHMQDLNERCSKAFNKALQVQRTNILKKILLKNLLYTMQENYDRETEFLNKLH